MGNAQNNCWIGIDIGGTNLRLALVDEKGAILQRSRMATNIVLGRMSLLERLIGGINDLRNNASSAGLIVSAIGVGVPGLISDDGFVYSSVNLPPLDGLNLRDELYSLSGLPVKVVNDANAIAMGEFVYGAGQSFGTLAVLTIGTGVGSGLILDGKLWTGADGVASEFGHVTVEPRGRGCKCGNHGCLEQYSSSTAILSDVRQSLKQGSTSRLAQVPIDEMTTEYVARAARDGDPLASALFAKAGRYLGIAAASLVNLLNPEAIILCGGVSASFDLLADPMRREVRARAFAIPAQRLQILKGTLGDDAGLLGSAVLAGMVH